MYGQEVQPPKSLAEPAVLVTHDMSGSARGKTLTDTYTSVLRVMLQDGNMIVTAAQAQDKKSTRQGCGATWRSAHGT